MSLSVNPPLPPQEALSINGTLTALMPAYQVFSEVDPHLEVLWMSKDGDTVVRGALFGEVHGSARSILVAERVALNFMQRMSGIATATHTMVKAVEVSACQNVICHRDRGA